MKNEERGLELAERGLLEGNVPVASVWEAATRSRLLLVPLSVQRCSSQQLCSSSEAVLEVTVYDEMSFSLTWTPKPAIAVSDW